MASGMGETVTELAAALDQAAGASQAKTATRGVFTLPQEWTKLVVDS
jgi:hypothetical protein